MKKDIHPTYFPGAKVKCVCGNAFSVGSTLEEINIEVCSACHPFFSGKAKVIDTAGKVEKFKERMIKKESMTGIKGGKKNKLAKREARREKARTQGPPTRG